MKQTVTLSDVAKPPCAVVLVCAGSWIGSHRVFKKRINNYPSAVGCPLGKYLKARAIEHPDSMDWSNWPSGLLGIVRTDALHPNASWAESKWFVSRHFPPYPLSAPSKYQCLLFEGRLLWGVKGNHRTTLHFGGPLGLAQPIC